MNNKHEMTNKEWEQAVPGITSRKARARAAGAILSQGGRAFNSGLSSELGTRGFREGTHAQTASRGLASGNIQDLPKDRAAIFDKLYESANGVNNLLLKGQGRN